MTESAPRCTRRAGATRPRRPAARRRPRTWSSWSSGSPSTPAAADVADPAPAPRRPSCSPRCARVVGADHVAAPTTTSAAAHPRQVDARPAPARAGDLSDAPDVVVRPADHDEVAAVLGSRSEHRVAVVPFGGGTSVTGGLVARRDGFAGVITLDLGRMKRLLAVDHGLVDRDARARPARSRGRGAARRARPDARPLPAELRVRLIGGFAATRSSGQSSAGYGRFDAMVVGLACATPVGDARRSAAPRANAAGPDLRQLFLGSEGAFGVITEVTVRVRPLPDGQGVRGLAVAVLRRRRRRDARARPGRPDADRAAALRRERDRDQPGPARRDRRRRPRAAAA